VLRKKSILSASSDADVKRRVLEALNGIDTCSLTWVGDSGDLLLNILDKDIDLAIIDENLTGISGSKLIQIVKKSRPRIPLIIISSGNPGEESAKVLEQGIFYFLVKPVKGEELRQAVESGLKTRP
jgi:DNA-binding NtrC family response regulator